MTLSEQVYYVPHSMFTLNAIIMLHRIIFMIRTDYFNCIDKLYFEFVNLAIVQKKCFEVATYIFFKYQEFKIIFRTDVF